MEKEVQMKKLIVLVGASLLVLSQALPLLAAEVETYDGPVSDTSLTMQECQNLGCDYFDAPTFPVVIHDYLPRHWACKCPKGTSCLNESSPH
jgi:hypothetical protein